MALSFFQSMKANHNALGDSKFPVEAIFRFSSALALIFEQNGADPIGELRRSQWSTGTTLIVVPFSRRAAANCVSTSECTRATAP
jgi:hypothetical protein